MRSAVSVIERAMTQYVVAALYKFTAFDTPQALISGIQTCCLEQGVKGTLLVATEGINGTIAGSRKGIDAVINHLRALPGCSDLEHKESYASENPFLRMKTRLKKEIVTLGVEGVDPNGAVGTYVAPGDWNTLIAADDVAVIDTRNDYEVAIGSFDGAIDPKTASFGDFPKWWEENKDQFEGKRIAMFCTGGIRCEKSTSYLKSQGVADVFHLQGGILKYLEEVPENQSRWSGECFVFDQRVSVGHGLEVGDYALCFACRRPITQADMASERYEKGVSCPQCYDEVPEERKERFRERQKQVRLAEERGTRHIGS